MTAPRPNRGPWTHRLLLRLFTVGLAILSYWLLGFVINDIGTWPGPDYSEIESRMLDQNLLKQAEKLAATITETDRKIANERTRQGILRDSTTNSQRTMNQLLDIRKLSLEKDIAPTQDEQDALAEAENLFLGNQRRYQTINDEIARLNEKLNILKEEQRALNKTLEERRRPVIAEHGRQARIHDLKVAAVKLVVLVPLLLFAVALFLRHRDSIYVSLLYAFGTALVIKVGVVMHEYFPTRYFKYILILIALAIVLRILVTLLRIVAHPGKDWLLKQYREAYEAFFCPICDYPIRRGPLKYVFWTRRTIKKRQSFVSPQAETDEPYTCPICASQLFEECEQCHAIRHSLLPACSKCGVEKQLVDAGESIE